MSSTAYYQRGAVLVSERGRRHAVLGCLATTVIMIDLLTRERLIRKVYQIAHWREEYVIDRHTMDILRRQLSKRQKVAA